jgi:hypothetical protein
MATAATKTATKLACDAERDYRFGINSDSMLILGNHQKLSVV